MRKHVQNLLLLLSSPVITTLILCSALIILILGMVFQLRWGLQNAERLIFNSWYFYVAGVIPVPGMKLIGAAVVIDLLLVLLNKLRQHISLSMVLIHTAIVFLIFISIFDSYQRKEYMVRVHEGERVVVPVGIHNSKANQDPDKANSITLRRFTVDFWPGSSTPRDYKSEIIFEDNGRKKNYTLSMNKPFVYKHAAIYQSSWTQENGIYVLTFLITQSWFRKVPYLCTVLFISGTVVFFLKRRSDS